MNIIHLVTDLSPINYGVWNVIIKSFDYFIKLESNPLIITNYTGKIHQELDSYKTRLKVLNNLSLTDEFLMSMDKDNTIIVSHGCWTFTSSWGYQLKKKGYKWVQFPHGMLEPWAMQQNKIRKKVYFTLFERRFLKEADSIVAVGTPEQTNLSYQFRKVVHIPNGVVVPKTIEKDYSGVVTFIFMGRLHHKKGISELANGWVQSELNNNPKFSLYIAGPDDGELKKLESIVSKSKNVSLLGPVYGDEKSQLLRRANFFVLPSHSEGFPTSIVEAMSYGNIPIISSGCNFPEAIAEKKAMSVEVSSGSIARVLNSVFKEIQEETIRYSTLSKQVKKYAQTNYSIDQVANRQYNLFKEILNEN